MDAATVDLAIEPRWIVPVQPAGLLADHALLVTGDRIVALLPVAEARARFRARSTVALPRHVLVPGLVNAHTHLAMALFRGIADDVPLQAWLERHIWPREARHVGPEFVFDGSLLAAAEMLRGGITCCQDMYFYPDAAARALRQAGMRGVLGIAVLEFATAYAADADAYLQTGLAARDAWRQEPLIGFSLAPHAPYTVADASFGKIVMYAEQLGLPVQTHLHETEREVAESLDRFGTRPLARLAGLAVPGPNFMAVHAVHMTDDDIATLARYGSHVVHCPSSNLKLASGVARVADMLRAGINVALGTDGAASNNRLDLFEEMRLAALLAKTRSGDASAVPAATALHMATLGGAAALGLAGEIGSLEAGKAADMAAVDLSAPENLPCYDPVSQLVYCASRHDVSHVWVAGRPVVEDGALLTVERAALASRARHWQERLA
jgi:5-methylthioadenosine/S-adenosylhomocysteine deaminase